jgi:hypothetical protein
VFSYERIRDLQGCRDRLLPEQRMPVFPGDRRNHRRDITKERMIDRLAQSLRRAEEASGHREATGTPSNDSSRTSCHSLRLLSTPKWGGVTKPPRSVKSCL